MGLKSEKDAAENMDTVTNTPIKVIEIGDSSYPSPFLDLIDPPKRIWVRGDLPHKWDLSISIVGPRKPSWYGVKMAKQFTQGLVEHRYIIVSGFMYGIDTVVHQTAVNNGGVTVAVLGSGLNVIYPKSNTALYRKIIAQKGCLISEYEPELEPTPWTFPKRNRLVAALGRVGTLVIEAGQSSGTLITAKFAEMLGRDVMAIPGNVGQITSEGTNNLIKTNAARIVTSLTDITAEISVGPGSVLPQTDFDSVQKLVLRILEIGPQSFAQIVTKSSLASEKVNKAIEGLLRSGLIGEDNDRYSKK